MISRASLGVAIRSHGTSINNNLVKGNKILESFYGVYVIAMALPTSSAYVDNVQVLGNKITNTLGLGSHGVVLAASGSGSFTGHVRTALAKGNTITHFSNGVVPSADVGQEVTGTFAPNKLKP